MQPDGRTLAGGGVPHLQAHGGRDVLGRAELDPVGLLWCLRLGDHRLTWAPPRRPVVGAVILNDNELYYYVLLVCVCAVCMVYVCDLIIVLTSS